MNKRQGLIRCMIGAALLLVSGWALASVPEGTTQTGSQASANSPVSVTYQNPKKFTESKMAGFGHGYNHQDYLGKLKAYLIQRASPMLKPGEHLAVTVTNIRLAGGYEYGRGPNWSDVRIMRDIYPPRISLHFTLKGDNGQVLQQGSRDLVGLSYLSQVSPAVGRNDPLRYDKTLLSKWLAGGPTKW